MEDALKQYFGYETFRPLQQEIIREVMAGRDCLVLMPTGGGKSICFQLPALLQPGMAVVVSPLISLMKDQVDALTTNGIAADFINSTLKPSQIADVMERALTGKLKILYLAPERLSVPGFTDFLQSAKVNLVAIDEAHCISQWGHDFRPDYRNLSMLKSLFPRIPMLALTATATLQVRHDIMAQLKLRDPRVFISSFNRPNLRYEVAQKKDTQLKIIQLLRQHSDQSCIIYCFSRNDTENLVASLRQHGFRAAAYHAGLNAKTRQQNQEQFIKDEINIIVATIAFGMGIDKPDVRLVIHHSMPKSVEGYYQETGRAGRDGLPSRCVMFYSYADRFKHEFFLQHIQDEDERDKVRQNLDEMIRFADSRNCRRSFLLRYFGEAPAQEICNNCDRCSAHAPIVAERKPVFAAKLPPAFNVAEAEGTYDKALFEQLRALRTQEAQRLRVPPYMVFGDKALIEMATSLPTDRDAFMEIYGVGEQKLAQFGQTFMALIRAHVSR